MLDSGRKALGALALATALAVPAGGSAHAEEPSPWLRDRGTGVATSMFGTYVKKGETLVYPFAELYFDSDLEYKPDELG
ncbi:MAG: hypothetical protein HY900_30235 [Deltaproteobacteria bacterium]|nr:hypothetical protein [Deltaproteobacteria bacterium]